MGECFISSVAVENTVYSEIADIGGGFAATQTYTTTVKPKGVTLVSINANVGGGGNFAAFKIVDGVISVLYNDNFGSDLTLTINSSGYLAITYINSTRTFYLCACTPK